MDTDYKKPMIFTRKVNRGGKRLPHCTYVLERAYVETVAANKARFTERQRKPEKTSQNSHMDPGKG